MFLRVLGHCWRQWQLKKVAGYGNLQLECQDATWVATTKKVHISARLRLLQSHRVRKQLRYSATDRGSCCR